MTLQLLHSELPYMRKIFFSFLSCSAATNICMINPFVCIFVDLYFKLASCSSYMRTAHCAHSWFVILPDKIPSLYVTFLLGLKEEAHRFLLSYYLGSSSSAPPSTAECGSLMLSLYLSFLCVVGRYRAGQSQIRRHWNILICIPFTTKTYRALWICKNRNFGKQLLILTGMVTKSQKYVQCALCMYCIAKCGTFACNTTDTHKERQTFILF